MVTLASFHPFPVLPCLPVILLSDLFPIDLIPWLDNLPHRTVLFQDRRSFPEYTGYLSSPERRMQSGEVVHNSYPGSGFENELYGYAGSRPSSVAGVVDDVARIKMENMERQLMNLTGLVQAALVQPNAQQTTSSAQSDMKGMQWQS